MSHHFNPLHPKEQTRVQRNNKLLCHMHIYNRKCIRFYTCIYYYFYIYFHLQFNVITDLIFKNRYLIDTFNLLLNYTINSYLISEKIYNLGKY